LWDVLTLDIGMKSSLLY